MNRLPHKMNTIETVSLNIISVWNCQNANPDVRLWLLLGKRNCTLINRSWVHHFNSCNKGSTVAATFHYRNISTLKFPIKLYSDNQSAITITYGNQQHSRSKHFNIWLYFLCDTVENDHHQISADWLNVSRYSYKRTTWSKSQKPGWKTRHTYIRLEGACRVHICI